MEVVVAPSAVVSEDVIAIDDFVEGISFEPGLLYEVDVEAFGFHHGNEVLIACVVVWLSGYQFAVVILGEAA